PSIRQNCWPRSATRPDSIAATLQSDFRPEAAFMKRSKTLLALVAIISFSLIGVALYLQHQLGWAPCPLCVIQRYLFILLGAICILSILLPHGATRIGAGLGAIAAASGAGVAGWHV